VEAYGTVDEANAFLGRARTSCLDTPAAAMAPLLADLQAELFVVGAELATVPAKIESLKKSMPLLADDAPTSLEKLIDDAEEGLAPMKHFVLAGGTSASADLHLARCVVRRAERLVVALAEQESVRPALLVYLNRLSDLLFTLARRANHLAGVDDVPWKPRG
ncbi:MAG: cob(I)yrinic acid a,c-diamide adenosyltransferase, partial [Polyangiales bacterium]